MAENVIAELKSDMEDIYKKSGDLLNLLLEKDFGKESKEVHDLFEIIKFRLQDFGGTLQKDIYNCEYLITKFKSFKCEYPNLIDEGREWF